MRFFYIICIVIVSCNQTKKTKELDVIKPNSFLWESYTDSLEIGTKGKNKIKVSCYRFDGSKSDSVSLQFYSSNDNQWILISDYPIRYNGIRGFDAKIEDLNNDGYFDFHYNSLEAARGANDIRKLFIYSPEYDSLIPIKNSESYPNLRYNKKLDCIDALLVSGSFYTVFLKLENDSLVKFASVDVADRIIVSEVNEESKNIILLDTINTLGPFLRFENYKPLEVLTY